MTVLSLSMFLSCATTSLETSWRLDPPPPDSMYTYFVGLGSGRGADAAFDDATSSLIAQVAQSLGVTVSVNTVGVTKATVDRYGTEVTQVVTTGSSGRLAGFSIRERKTRTDSRTGLVTAYLLAAYETRELARERSRIEEERALKVAALSEPEEAGDLAASRGRASEAIRFYVDAMAAAAVSELQNASLFFDRTAAKARTLASSIRIQASVSEIRVTGSAAKLDLKVTGPAGIPVTDAALRISYPKKLPSGRLGTAVVAATTDSSGLATAGIPSPDFAGKGRILVQLEMDAALSILDGLGGRYVTARDALGDVLRSVSIDLAYVSESRARIIPMAVFAVDVDEKGRAAGSDGFQSGLLEYLGREKFVLTVLPLDPALAVVMNDDRILIATGQSGFSGERLAYGLARVDSVRKDGAFFVVSASARLKVVEMKSGRVLYSAERSWQAVGADEASARRNAYRELGFKVVGPDLAGSLL